MTQAQPRNTALELLVGVLAFILATAVLAGADVCVFHVFVSMFPDGSPGGGAVSVLILASGAPDVIIGVLVLVFAKRSLKPQVKAAMIGAIAAALLDLMLLSIFYAAMWELCLH